MQVNTQKSSSDTTKPVAETPREISPLGIVISDPALPKVAVVFLDFENLITHLFIYDSAEDLSNCKYPLNREIIISRDTVNKLIDLLGGVTVDTADGKWRYTGNQLCDMLYDSSTCDTEFISKILKSIGKSKISKEQFLFLWKNVQTNLSYVDFFNCREFLSDTLANTVIYE